MPQPLFIGHSLGAATNHSFISTPNNPISSTTSQSLNPTTIHSFQSLQPACRQAHLSFTIFEHNGVSTSSKDDMDSVASIEFWQHPEPALSTKWVIVVVVEARLGMDEIMEREVGELEFDTEEDAAEDSSPMASLWKREAITEGDGKDERWRS
ncbi:hypothetical protein FH972_017607 [Carpinus fangiana]|uniref:Uncharacterized protein n=1 Tax=Carpinus fangiana TaxID=176857 RepID=A0A5N6RJE4_9ROSI|nr:hypothetical protein FH972_017607 [Carpinus fangiana]